MLRWIFVFLLPWFVPWFVSSRTNLKLVPCFVSSRTNLKLNPTELKRFHFTENKMGSPFNLIFYHADSTAANAIAKECFSIVDSLNNIFSDYSSNSEVGRLAQQPTVHDYEVSTELYNMIWKSKMAWRASAGAFDITIGALTQLWRKAKSENRFPSPEEIKAARRLTGFKKLSYDVYVKTISFNTSGMLFDFGGIVKGYAAQKIVDYLKSKGVTIALADAGGDIAVSNAPPGKKGWNIRVNLPEQAEEFWDKRLELSNCAVATSGDLYNFILHDGKKYSHIIDPRTGYGVTSQRNVTVIAKDGATADWLSTACSILSIKQSLALANKEKAALFIATLKKEKLTVYKTENVDTYFEKNETGELP
jgi:FAD:protein FMN transferase